VADHLCCTLLFITCAVGVASELLYGLLVLQQSNALDFSDYGVVGGAQL